MIPCTVAVRKEESIKTAREMMHRARLSVLPVIDDQLQFVGYISEAQLTGDISDETRVGQVAETEVPTFDQNASFAAVMNHFVDKPRSLVFVCRSGQPVGWITQRSLVALSESLNEKSFATNLPASHSTSYLLVPDAVLTTA
jgi:predicted transcriptional regulator